MSGKRDSNSRPSAWEANALPTELLPHCECKIKTFFSIQCAIKDHFFYCFSHNIGKKLFTFAASMKIDKNHRDVAQLASAPRSGRGGRVFESPHPDLHNKDGSFRLSSFFFYGYFCYYNTSVSIYLDTRQSAVKAIWLRRKYSAYN